MAETTNPNYGANAAMSESDLVGAIRREALLEGEAVGDCGVNARQVGGAHYMTDVAVIQHWDLVHRMAMDYYVGQITRYLSRAHRKNGAEDYEKALHYIEKRQEIGYDLFNLAPDGTWDGMLWSFFVGMDMPTLASRAMHRYLYGDPSGAAADIMTLVEESSNPKAETSRSIRASS